MEILLGVGEGRGREVVTMIGCLVVAIVYRSVGLMYDQKKQKLI